MTFQEKVASFWLTNAWAKHGLPPSGQPQEATIPEQKPQEQGMSTLAKAGLSLLAGVAGSIGAGYMGWIPGVGGGTTPAEPPAVVAAEPRGDASLYQYLEDIGAHLPNQ